MKTRTIYPPEYPYLLRQIKPLPKSMELAGTLPSDDNKFLCVVGSRTNSNYGEQVCRKLIAGLKGYPIVIVSGMAIGIDSIAHEAAIEAGLKTVSFPGSGLSTSVLYPPSRRKLAEKIIEGGGALISSFSTAQGGVFWTFPHRNRLMAGMSHATLVIEARRKAGSLGTARNAGEFNRDLMAVPGPIFSELSEGTNNLLRSGAIAVTSSIDILEDLGFAVYRDDLTGKITRDYDQLDLTDDQRRVIDAIKINLTTSTDIVDYTLLSAINFNIIISELELKGLIIQKDGHYQLT